MTKRKDGDEWLPRPHDPWDKDHPKDIGREVRNDDGARGWQRRDGVVEYNTSELARVYEEDDDID